MPGPWRAWLDSPGGELPFRVDFRPMHGGLRVLISNGVEQIEVPKVFWQEKQLVLDIDYYDSIIRAKVSEDGVRLDGQWTKRRGPDQWTKMAFHAITGAASRFPIKLSGPEPRNAPSFDGRWAVSFSGSDDPAVGIFRTFYPGTAVGTFLTTGGDYRYLAGNYDERQMRLSCFDGAHAFLFHATRQADGTLKGDFWSADKWHQTWTAKPDEKAELPDAFAQVEWTGKVPLGKVTFPDLDGKQRSLDDPAFKGKARIISIFGSWCPNCHDDAKLLQVLHRRYSGRGLSIVGLAFELTGDQKRDAEQVRKFIARHKLTYPVLIAGVKGKAKSSEAFPLLDRIRAYPTTVFMDSVGEVYAVHTGITGPASGDLYHEMWDEFETIIEGLLLDEAEADKP